MKKVKPKNVASYIAAAPKETRSKLRELRAAIRKTAPKAEEKISYGIPYYGYKGRLIYFSVWKTHIGIYIPTPVVAELKSELKGYKTTSATVRLPLDKKLPIGLIKKMVKARMKLNDAGKGKK
jgi:uncharacterized protein YdhG (YjbR/CyaY superfamily)